MVGVLAVNNYPSGERFQRLLRALKDNGATVTAADWRDSSARMFDSVDGVVLSGSPDMLSDERVQMKYSQEVEAIRETRVPVLGVCFGHQLMGHAFGSRVVGNGSTTLRYVETEVLTEDPLFSQLPRRITVMESHAEVIDRLPESFRLLARSPSSAIAAMRHSRLPLYGLQFHPERNSQVHPDGNAVVSNFLKVLR